MRKQKLAAAILLSGLSLTLIAWYSDYQFKLNRVFEVYGNAVREITNNYLNDIPVDSILKNSIEGMLANLDPYAEFFGENNESDIELITDGNYIGFGFTVGLIDSMLTIVKIRDNTPAFNSGLHVGDIIYSINDNIVINKEDIKEFSKGKAGSLANLKILRGNKDTLDYAIKRAAIHLPSVTIAKVLDSNIAYIKIERFSRKCAIEFITAFNKLYTENRLKGLIIDVRDNPGGILSEAVGICELFVPSGSKIVSTKGKHNKYSYDYYSHNEPVDTTLPIAVLVNGNSASASEILAGAMQDLDRAIIIGSTSFGKGLVQMVFELSDKHSMKLTTAKYYTPSGRCIQKIDYSNAEKTSVDTVLFYTHNGREVYELNGIKPDCEIPDKSINNLIPTLLNGMIFFHYANIFCEQNSLNRFEYTMNDKIYNDFVKFTTKRENSQKLAPIKAIINVKANSILSNKAKSSIEKTVEAIEEDMKFTLLNNFNAKQDAKKILDYEIKARFYSEIAVFEDFYRDDTYISKSIDLFCNGKYKSMLAGAPPTQNNK